MNKDIDIERRKKLKAEALKKYFYVLVLFGIVLLGTSYGLVFFKQNTKVSEVTIQLGSLVVTLSDNGINASGLTSASDQSGMSEFSKQFTITNTTSEKGIVKLYANRLSGLNYSDLRYALVVNGAIQEIGDLHDGEILTSAIYGNEVINVEIRIWPRETYSGNVTTFMGTIEATIDYLGKTGVETFSSGSASNNYINFNCDGSTCETWRIVKVEDNRLVLTKESDYSNAASRTNSGLYDTSLSYYDSTGMVVSQSIDKKNVYLKKSVKIVSGSGTSADPYILKDAENNETDNKIVGIITYKDTDGTTTLGTQRIYVEKKNYISRPPINALGWSDGANTYNLGKEVSFTTNKTLNAQSV